MELSPSNRQRLYGLGVFILSFFFMFLGTNTASHAQFATITALGTQPAEKNTADKPQSKVWQYDGKWFTVFPNTAGTYIWRLDGSNWTSVLKLTTGNTTRADCKVVNNVVHIFLWKKEGTTSQLFSAEYVPASSTYKVWSQRTTPTSVTLETGTETGVIDVDGNGRMWLTNDGVSNIYLRYSDYPYTTWSSPMVMANNVKDDDISSIVALPNQHQVGIFWSNQNTKRFGFKVHNDNDAPTVWSADETPAAQFANDNIGGGLGDDHMNLKYASDGTLYCALKTSFDTKGYPRVALIKRSPDGTWGNLYEVTETGTRAVVLLNESTRKLKVVFSQHEDGGNIYYKESSMDNIAFGPQLTLMSGVYNNASASKDNYTSDVVVIASTVTANSTIVGIRGVDGTTTAPAAPTLVAPADLATGLAINPALSWNSSSNATGYRVQISTTPDFATLLVDQNNISATSYQANALAYNTTYYWRVSASNQIGSSDWSLVRSLTTVNPVPAVPVLTSPTASATNVTVSPTFTWTAGANATSYNLQVSTASDFSNIVVNQNAIAGTSFQSSALANATTYFWRVQSVNQFGVSAFVSSSFSTIIAAPVAPALQAPANAETNVSLSPTLTWSASANATSYSIQVSTNAAFTSFVINQSALASTSYQASGLANGTTYFWRVLASNIGGSSAWSSVNSFATLIALPAIPTLTTPVNNETSVSLTPTLTWNSVATAASYNVQVSTASDFSTTIADLTGITTTSVGISGLANGTAYFWRAQSTNTTGSSAWSTASKFTTLVVVSGNNIVGYWPMNEGSGNTLIDNSSLGNNAALTGTPTWVTGVGALAVRLSGTQQQATVADANSLDISQSITLAAWIKPEKLASQNVIKKGTTGGEDGYELSLLSTGKIQFRFNQNSSALYNLNSNALYPTDGNTWMHIAATYTNAVVKIYINGVLNKSVTFTTPPPIATNSQPLLIGGPNFFMGALDEVRVYNYALDATQIATIANPGNAGTSAASTASAVQVMSEVPLAGSRLDFYPNPVQDVLTIDFAGEDDKDVQVAITDLQGRMHYKETPHIENSKLEINVGSMNAGIHVLIVKTAAYQKVFKFTKK